MWAHLCTLHECMCACVYIHMCACVYIHICACVYIHICACVYIHMWALCTQIHEAHDCFLAGSSMRRGRRTLQLHLQTGVVLTGRELHTHSPLSQEGLFTCVHIYIVYTHPWCSWKHCEVSVGVACLWLHAMIRAYVCTYVHLQGGLDNGCVTIFICMYCLLFVYLLVCLIFYYIGWGVRFCLINVQ